VPMVTVFGLDLSTVTVSELLHAAPRFEVQVVLAIGQSIFWFLAIRLGAAGISAIVQTWPEKTRKQWTKMNQATFKKSFFVDFDEQGAYIFACAFIVILLQHAIGGSLCVPSVLGILPGIAPVLARHGGLCEVGWEVQDYLSRWWDIIFGGPEGRARQPAAIMILMTLHHAMGTCLVVPMNVYFGSNPLYHEMIFLLQAAAFGAMGLQQYGYTLDISKRGDLVTMKILVTITAAIMLYSRCFRYLYVAYGLCQLLKAEGGNMYYAGLAVCVMMGVLNIIFLLDAVTKAVKFLSKSMPAYSKLGLKKQLTTLELQELDDLAADALSATTPAGSVLSRGRKEWAKVRGLHKMGLLKAPKKTQ